MQISGLQTWSNFAQEFVGVADAVELEALEEIGIHEHFNISLPDESTRHQILVSLTEVILFQHFVSSLELSCYSYQTLTYFWSIVN